MARTLHEPLTNANLETGNTTLYPAQASDEIRLRWAFIRKIYLILTIQLLITIVVASVVVFVTPVADFLVSTQVGFFMCMFTFFYSAFLVFSMYCYYRTPPLNYILLAEFTVFVGLAVGLTCAFTAGNVILEATILTAVVVVSLMLYTFWAERRGHDFSFLAPILLAGCMVLLVFILIQIFVPLGRLSVMIYGALASIILSGFIIYDTDNLMRRYTYDQYLWAAVVLYLDVLNFFPSRVTLVFESFEPARSDS